MIVAHENPFRASCIEAIPYRMTDSEFVTLFTHFRTNCYRGVLVGPHGSGKTTLREHLEQQLRDDGHHVHTIILQDTQIMSWSLLREHLQQTTNDTIISVDGIDRLNPLLWWRLQRTTRHYRGLLATSHVTGRLPLLRHHHTSPDLLMSLVQTLTSDHESFTNDHCHRLFQRHQGNIRNCLRELYDTWDQIQSTPCSI